MPTKLIIDTDPGVDDAFAIALAALSDEVDLLGVTSVYGNVPLAATTINARRVLALCGRDDVPVAAGAQRPLVHRHPNEARYVHGADGLSGRSHALPEPSRPLDERDAVTLMADLLAASGSLQMLNSAAAVVLPWPSAPPMITMRAIFSAAAGWAASSAAMLVNGPMGAMVTGSSEA
ncbi:nucleoside hydrolase, partial [Streptomyces regensis]